MIPIFNNKLIQPAKFKRKILLMIVQREMNCAIMNLAKQYPVITITGPRQSGKTTLVKSLFSNYNYYSLEYPDIREVALTDPRALKKKK